MATGCNRGNQGRRATDPMTTAEGEAFSQHIDDLLAYVVRTNASDLHLSPGLPPMARIDGVLAPIPQTAPLNAVATAAFLETIASSEQRDRFEEQWEIDFSFGRRSLGRYRANAFLERGEIAVAIRRIPDVPPTLEDLGLPAVLGDIAQLKRGLVLVTGPTGSGKSTTLAAMINKINRERAEHIITIEDPIEFIHCHDCSIVQQREVGRDTHEFSAALRSALREDPDVILIGEMRDLETISAAVSAAEAGHLVFATLHTKNASQSIDRIIDVFPPNQQAQIRLQLSASLQAVVAQRLVPVVIGGRMCVMEVLLANEAVRNLIREGKTHQIDLAMQSGVQDGMIIFDMMLADLVRRGEIAGDVALLYCNDPRSFAARGINVAATSL
jgi:twitching motility protein PilT